jgi:crotonobetainyl-CoA:carnitine CoA-transferase CaiB-like acyl-CoA transferase
MAGALDGIVVADFSRVLAGPYCTMLLGDLGAEVVKVERPGTGDDTRTWGPPWSPTGPGGANEATYYLGINRNKRSVALDLHDPADVEQARALATSADVMVQNFKPGGLARLGLGYDAVRELNRGIVYCSISGFGTAGGQGYPGYDLLVQATGGLMSITGPAPNTPTATGVAVVDVITGLHAAMGILAALHHRERTGEGQHVEVNLLSSLLSALVNQASAYVAGDTVPTILGNKHPSIAPYELFPTADRDVVLAVGNDGQFAALARVLGHPELAGDPRFVSNPQRVAHRQELRDVLIPLLAEHSADHWFHTLLPHGVPCGPVNGIDDAVKLADTLGLDPVVEVEGVRTVRNPVKLSATPATYRRRPPRLPG